MLHAALLFGSLDVDAAVRVRPLGAGRGALYPSDSHTGLPFSIVLEATPEGLSVGRFAFTSTMIPRAEAKLQEAGEGSFVLLIGPYYDPFPESDMLTRVEGRRAGERIFGELYTTRAESGERNQEGTRHSAFMKTAEEKYPFAGQVGTTQR